MKDNDGHNYTFSIPEMPRKNSNMTQVYKGHEITVVREECLAGYDLLYVDIIRLSDGFHALGFYEDSAETVRDMMKHMKARVDAELLDDDPWGEGEL